MIGVSVIQGRSHLSLSVIGVSRELECVLTLFLVIPVTKSTSVSQCCDTSHSSMLASIHVTHGSQVTPIWCHTIFMQQKREYCFFLIMNVKTGVLEFILYSDYFIMFFIGCQRQGDNYQGSHITWKTMKNLNFALCSFCSGKCLEFV